MKTDKQITNAYNRAAKLAFDAASASQQVMFAASAEQMASERGNAQCAAGFAAQALAKLENGDYAGFLTNLRLASTFVRDASDLHSMRTPLNWRQA